MLAHDKFGITYDFDSMWNYFRTFDDRIEISSHDPKNPRHNPKTNPFNFAFAPLRKIADPADITITIKWGGRKGHCRYMRIELPGNKMLDFQEEWVYHAIMNLDDDTDKIETAFFITTNTRDIHCTDEPYHTFIIEAALIIGDYLIGDYSS